MPAPGRWWLFAPALIACALPLRGWIPTPLGASPFEFSLGLGAALLAISAAELWFRGLVHGLLSLDFPVQHPGGPRFLSRAAIGSACAYAAVATTLTARALSLGTLPDYGITAAWVLGGVAVAALVAGLILGSVRERSLSLGAGVSLQMLGVAATCAAWLGLQ